MTEVYFSNFSVDLGKLDKNEQYKSLRKSISHKILSAINKFYFVKIDNNDYEAFSFYREYMKFKLNNKIIIKILG